MSTVAVVLAAGEGTRFGQDKALVDLRGKPLWRHSFETLLSHPGIDAVGVLASASNFQAIHSDAPDACFVQLGGGNRTESSRKAVELAEADRILVHDAARPLVSQELIARVLDALDSGAVAAAPAVPVADTIRQVSGTSTAALDRTTLFAMQTPQAAVRSVLQRAYIEVTGAFTDEMAVLEAIGIQPTLVAGEARNFKVTEPDDLLRAAALLGPPETRTGMGYDVHAFSDEPNRQLWLGGVRFEGRGLAGHSDADALLHAAIDALLGAAGEGDIGVHFPNTDPQWHNAPSRTFLEYSAELLRQKGWQVLNLDLTVIAEHPKIMPQVEAIRAAIGDALRIEIERISVKATTNERLGAIGRGEGIAAFAIATIRQLA